MDYFAITESVLKKMKRILCMGLSLFFVHGSSHGQELETSLPLPTVVVHTDPRLEVILKRHKQVQTGAARSQRGYRVQIYSGNDRHKANEIRMDFMKRFPEVRTYLSYVQPQFRVKVGDYVDREEARLMYLKVSPLYNPCMIVPDIALAPR